MLRIPDPVDVELEAGCFADRLVKRGGPAIKFEQPRLPDGSISKFPLLMNLYGTRERTCRALGVEAPKQVGERMVALMKAWRWRHAKSRGGPVSRSLWRILTSRGCRYRGHGLRMLGSS